MNKTYSPDHIQKTGDLNADLNMKQNKLDKIAKLMEIISNNPRPIILKSLFYWNYHLYDTTI